jgi:hypothetical protein
MLLAMSMMVMAWGCGPTPEKVCKKMADLADKAKDAKKSDAKDKDKDMADCVKQMETMQKEQPEAFKCVASCTDMSDSDQAMGCVFGCAMKAAPKDKGGDDKK